MLRDRIDMLYEVSADALDSLTGATNVSVFTFTFGTTSTFSFSITRSPTSRDRATVRRALNARSIAMHLMQDGLNGHGDTLCRVQFGPNTGPFDLIIRQFLSIPRAARADRRRQVAQRPAAIQLSRAAGTANASRLLSSGNSRRSASKWKSRKHRSTQSCRLLQSGDFDAVLTEYGQRTKPLSAVSDVALGGLVQPWHAWGAVMLDAALDRIRYATTDDEYQAAVARSSAGDRRRPSGDFPRLERARSRGQPPLRRRTPNRDETS